MDGVVGVQFCALAYPGVETAIPVGFWLTPASSRPFFRLCSIEPGVEVEVTIADV